MKVKHQGKEIEVDEVGVIMSNEPWNEYQLEDGKVLSIKTVLVDVARAVDERAPDGSPLYIIKTHNIVKVK